MVEYTFVSVIDLFQTAGLTTSVSEKTNDMLSKIIIGNRKSELDRDGNDINQSTLRKYNT